MRKKSITRMTWAEVQAEVRDAIESHGFRDADSVAWHMLDQRKEIKGRDHDFHTACTFHAIYNEARAQLNKPRLNPAQTEFVGFDLQQQYDIERDGRQQHVLTLEMTCQELVDKAMERRTCAKTMMQEADELIRFARAKFGDEAVDECLGRVSHPVGA